MAYQRDIVFRSALLQWQRVMLASPAPDWSAAYRVDGPRLLIPLTRCFECRIGGDDFTCDPASALWLTPASSYRMRQPFDAQRSVLICLDSGIGGGFDAGDLAALGASRRAPLSMPAKLRIDAWSQRLRDGGVEALEAEEAALGMVRALLGEEADVDARPHRAVERARAYIAAEPQRADTLAGIAKAVHCSPFHLARLFRRLTGHSLHGFRTRLRMTMALDRLRDGEADLSTLALDLGYASHSHFGDAFRRAFGVAPSRMRTIPEARRRP